MRNSESSSTLLPAAGGVGLNLCQMASHFGAHVIGTTSTLEKAELAKQNGAETVVVGGDPEALQKEVDRLTGGLGVHGTSFIP